MEVASEVGPQIWMLFTGAIVFVLSLLSQGVGGLVLVVVAVVILIMQWLAVSGHGPHYQGDDDDYIVM